VRPNCPCLIVVHTCNFTMRRRNRGVEVASSEYRWSVGTLRTGDTSLGPLPMADGQSNLKFDVDDWVEVTRASQTPMLGISLVEYSLVSTLRRDSICVQGRQPGDAVLFCCVRGVAIWKPRTSLPKR
jgi:hypothetical protein